MTFAKTECLQKKRRYARCTHIFIPLMNQQTIREVVDFAALQPSSYLVMKERFFCLAIFKLACEGWISGWTCFPATFAARVQVEVMELEAKVRDYCFQNPPARRPVVVWNFSESRLDVWKVVAFIIVTWDVWEERRSSVNNEQAAGNGTHADVQLQGIGGGT